MNYIDNVEILDFSNFKIIVSKINGRYISVEKRVGEDKEKLIALLNENEFFSEPIYPKTVNKGKIKTVYISLHISSDCNMSCTYCFKTNRSKGKMSFAEAKEFIDLMINTFPHAGKYIVDPTGSGEPLLEMDLLLSIGEYCKKKSNTIKREVLPMIVTNGTLLDSNSVSKIRNAGILFGVSLDGDKKRNDFFRTDYNGNGVYKKVVKNIKAIKDRTLMGVAVTLTRKNTDLVSIIKHLIKYFPTISIKPVRDFSGDIGVNLNNVEILKQQYSKLMNFLIREIQKGNTEYLAALLNGDDYFGKFILRTILRQRVFTRCDAGIGRFSLAKDGRIYVCPGAIDIEEFEIGNLKDGIDLDKREEIHKIMIEKKKCSDCFARFVCGGECLVNSYYLSSNMNDVDYVMCNLKKHLFKLSLLFEHIIKKTKYYNRIFLACVEKSKRFSEDLNVTEYLNQNPDVSFMDIKMNRDKYLEKERK